MVSGCICGSAFKIGSGFSFVSQNRVSGASDNNTPYMTSYCAELGAYYGTRYDYISDAIGRTKYVTVDTSGVTEIRDSNGLIVRNGVNSTSQVNISPANFCEVTVTTSGNGSASVGGTSYAQYRRQGDVITVSFYAASGYKVKKVLKNGSDLGSIATHQFTVQTDVSFVVYFVPTQYQVTCTTSSGGTSAFTKNGTAQSVPFYANVDDVIVCTATPDTTHMVQNFAVDGTVASGGSYVAQTFSFTIYERQDDATYNCNVTFSGRPAVTNHLINTNSNFNVYVELPGHTSVVVEEDGSYLAYAGNEFSAYAQEGTDFVDFVGWFNANGEQVGYPNSDTGNKLTWVQGSDPVYVIAKYQSKETYTEYFYIGTSTSDYGTSSGTAYEAGCRATITRPSVAQEGKYLGGSHTVTATATPTGWTFSGVYVDDTDKTGGTQFIKANGSNSVTFVSNCNVKVYAIFATSAVVDVPDKDQGNSTIASGSSANGLYAWEGGASTMAMRWHSGRYVSNRPMALSTARVYADAYASGQTKDVKLKVLTFESPDSTDAHAVDVTANSQNAFRLPMRRPEKYIEMVLSAPHQITQAAVATSMEALWQA